MTVRLPESGADDFLRAWKRRRIRSVVLWSPILFVLIGACAAGFLMWQGHGVLHLLAKIVPDRLLWPASVTGLLLFAALGAAFVGYTLIRDCHAVSVPFCVACQKAQHSFRHSCDGCGAELRATRSYVYILYEDEKQIALARGLTDEQG